MKGVVYEYYNSKSNMYYIGITRQSFSKRDWEHRHPQLSNYFDNVYSKHPEDFTSKILVELNLLNKKLLISTLNILEISYIKLYKCKGRSLYNILEGGSLGWSNAIPTQKMLDTLTKYREEWNTIQKQNKFSSEECKLRHSKQSKEYNKRHPDKYKEIYTKANQRRKQAKHEWYLKNKERLLNKQKQVQE